MNLKNLSLTGTFAVALLFSACDKDDDVAEVNNQDETFIVQASQSNRAEIELGNIALQNGASAGVRTYAQMMITDHTAAQTDLQNVVNGIDTDANMNDSLDADQKNMRTALLSFTPGTTAFDSAYMASQVLSHDKTIAAFNSEISGGQNEQVKGYATTKLPAIQMHRQMADSIFTTLAQ